MSTSSDQASRQPPSGTGEHLFALPAGTDLFEYRILRVLGHGGFGITYLAADAHLNKTIAIKEYLPSGLAARVSDASVRPKSPEDEGLYRQGREAFLNEARLLARFDHPSIVKVHRFFEANGTAYIVLAYLEGRPLEGMLRETRPDETTLRAMLARILDGLQLIHSGAVLHRDIKPTNIIIRPDGSPVLIDFGSARNFYGLQTRDVTAIISPGYSPPEQFGVAGQQGPWTDLYALGAVAYRAVTGQVPPDALRRLRHDPYRPAIEAAEGQYSPSLLRAIDWALAVDETKRPQSAEALRAALDPAPVAPPPPRRRALALSLLGAAVIAAGSWIVLRPTPLHEQAAPPVASAAAEASGAAPGSTTLPAPAMFTQGAFAALLAGATRMSPGAIEERYRSYGARAPHKAMAAVPGGTTSWTLAGMESADAAVERVHEACQLAYGSPCFLVARDERLETRPDGSAAPARDMPRNGYKGPFDPERIPSLVASSRQRPELRDYRSAPPPKAVALHPWGRSFIVTGAASQTDAEAQALARCNGDPSRGGRDGPCFLYASGDLVVLPERRTKASSPP